MIMMGKPPLIQNSMMKGATVTITPPIVATKPVPKTLTCVGYSSLKYTQKQVYQREMANLKMKIRARTPILLPMLIYSSASPCFQMKTMAREHMKVRRKHPQAAVFLLILEIIQQERGKGSREDIPITKPFMKRLRLNWSNISAGAQNQNITVHWTITRNMVVIRRDLYLKRSRIERVFFFLLGSLLSLQLYSDLIPAIYSTEIEHDFLFNLAIYLNSLKILSEFSLRTKLIGVSATKTQKQPVASTRGTKKKMVKISCQSLSQQNHRTLVRMPKLQKNWMITYNFYLLCSDMVQEMKKKQILKAFWMPKVDRKRPTPAIVRSTLNMVSRSPKIVVARFISINFFLPVRLPSKERPRQPTTLPMYIIVMTKSTYIFQVWQRQSPKELGRVLIVCLGMKDDRQFEDNEHTQLRHCLPMRLLEQWQGSWQKRKGVTSTIPPVMKPIRHKMTERMV